MPDGSTFTPTPSLDIARGFWSLYTGDANATIRLVLLPAVPNLSKKEREKYPDAP